MLRKGVGSEGTKANLTRMAGKQKDTSRGAKLTNKNINVNYVAARSAALPPMVKLTARTGTSVQEQARACSVSLSRHVAMCRLVSIFATRC